MFSDEVIEMRQAIRDCGSYDDYTNAPHHNPQSYKAQALLELAARIELQEELRRLKSLVHAVTHVLDCNYTGDEYAFEKMSELEDARTRVKPVRVYSRIGKVIISDL
jgi:hypothetical protein